MTIRIFTASIMLLSGLVLGQPAMAANYYVDSVAGKDANSGASASAPWKTLRKVNRSALEPGSTVFLKRGSKWRESLFVPSSRVTVDAYGKGAKPILDSSVPITGWVSAGKGIYRSPEIKLSDPGGALGNLSEDGKLLALVPWAGTAKNTLNGAPRGSFSYDVAKRILYIRRDVNPDTDDTIYRASTLFFGVGARDKTDIVVRNLNIRRFSLHGVYFDNCDRCEVRNSVITDGGGAVVIRPNLYAGNGVEWNGKSAGGVASGLTIRNIFDSGISPQTVSPENNRISDIVIRDSSIDRCGFAGVEISALGISGPGASISDVRVTGVTITNSGRGWGGNRYGGTAHGVRIVADQNAGTLSGIAVSRTTVTDSVGNGVEIEGDVGTVALDRLSLSRNNNGVNVFSNDGQSPSLQVVLTASTISANRSNGAFYAAPSSGGFNLSNNVFFSNGPRNLNVRDPGDRAIVGNNLFLGEEATTHIHVSNMVDITQSSLDVQIDQNCYTRSSRMFSLGTLFLSLAELTAATGFDSHSVAVEASSNQKLAEDRCREAQGAPQ